MHARPLFPRRIGAQRNTHRSSEWIVAPRGGTMQRRLGWSNAQANFRPFLMNQNIKMSHHLLMRLSFPADKGKTKLAS
jgi:hypothetical protein